MERPGVPGRRPKRAGASQYPFCPPGGYASDRLSDWNPRRPASELLALFLDDFLKQNGLSRYRRCCRRHHRGSRSTPGHQPHGGSQTLGQGQLRASARGRLTCDDLPSGCTQRSTGLAALRIDYQSPVPQRARCPAMRRRTAVSRHCECHRWRGRRSPRRAARHRRGPRRYRTYILRAVRGGDATSARTRTYRVTRPGRYAGSPVIPRLRTPPRAGVRRRRRVSPGKHGTPPLRSRRRA